MIPEKFKTRMSRLLGDEWQQLEEALGREPVKGVRLNLCKAKDLSLEDALPCPAVKIPYTDNGYIPTEQSGLGTTPHHHTGLIYVQDPGAMAPINALNIEPDWQVADLCAAPGGKSGQIAERLGKNGFLLSNEYVPKRAKITVGNMERLGIKQAMVTSMSTKELTGLFREHFDLVVCDAPCSGEGMFRKSSEALSEWSEENIKLCAERQAEILDNAAVLVKPGGYLLYSTCTYSPEENEMTVDGFLNRHSDYFLTPVNPSLAALTRDGIVPTGSERQELKLARRFYPHVSPGEGQFLALMKRADGQATKQTILYKGSSKPLTRQDREAVDSFFKQYLISPPDGRVVMVHNNPVIIQHGCPIPPNSVFMPGVLLGEIKGVVRPSHQFFSCYGRLFKVKVELGEDERLLHAYLSGEEIPVSGGDGWCAVTFHGAPLGGGKISSGRMKNHYPKGLRLK